MKTNTGTLNSQTVEGTIGTRQMGMDANSQAIVFQMFTKNIYSNAIGSVVREITSNCFDSHTEAKINPLESPVIIRKSFDPITKSHYISFHDFGMGISPDRMDNVYGVFFKSTKAGDNEQIGGFGIGGKTPLAYKRSTGFGEGEYDNSFSIITNFDGIRYEYIVFEGKKGPEYTDPIMSETTEHNGTEIKIPVLEKDITKFKSEMVKQLYYFENVIFEGFVNDPEYPTATENLLTNAYQIVKGKTFFYRGNDYSQYTHVCLGRVAYPINFGLLGLDGSDYRFPVAIKLEIGEIGVTASRETLDYSEQTIKVLKVKLEAVKAEITAMLSKQYENIVTLEDYFKVKNQFGVLYMPNGGSFKVGEIIKQKDVDFSNFKYGFMKMPNDKQLFNYFFETKLYGKKIKKSKKNNYEYDDEGNRIEEGELVGGYDTIINKHNVLYHFEGEFQRKLVKQAWLKNQCTTFYTVTTKNIVNRFETRRMSDLFNVDDKVVERGLDGQPTLDANGQQIPTVFMKGLLELQQEYFEIISKYCTAYDAVVVPEDFKESRKNGARRLSQEYKNMTIPVKIFGGYRGTFRVKLDSLFKLHIPIFYGTKENDYQLRQAKEMFGILFESSSIIGKYNERTHEFRFDNGKKGIMFLQISQGNVRYMEYCQQAYHINEFKTKMLKRKENAVMEYFQSQNFVHKFDTVNSFYKSKAFGKVAPEWQKKTDKINAFIKKQYVGYNNNWDRYRSELSRYFDINGIEMTKEQQKFEAIIEEFSELEEMNSETMRYLDVPSYDLDDEKHTAFWAIVKKVLVY
jgi:hypothetical protein